MSVNFCYKHLLSILDDQYIYISGETHRDVIKYPWKPRYHLAVVAKINRSNGKLISYLHFGNDSVGGHTRVSNIFQQGDSLILFGAKNTASLIQFEEKYSQAHRWILRKDRL